MTTYLNFINQRNILKLPFGESIPNAKVNDESWLNGKNVTPKECGRPSWTLPALRRSSEPFDF